MVIPSAMFVEMAQDSLKTADKAMLDDEAKEFASAVGGQSAMVMTATEGYLLGIQTARMFLAGSVLLAKAKIDPGELL